MSFLFVFVFVFFFFSPFHCTPPCLWPLVASSVLAIQICIFTHVRSFVQLTAATAHVHQDRAVRAIARVSGVLCLVAVVFGSDQHFMAMGRGEVDEAFCKRERRASSAGCCSRVQVLGCSPKIAFSMASFAVASRSSMVSFFRSTDAIGFDLASCFKKKKKERKKEEEEAK